VHADDGIGRRAVAELHAWRGERLVSIVETRVIHDWRIVAPWWHWPLAAGSTDADRAAVRLSAPVLQKYDTPDAVNTFLADPQLRLRFVEDSDRVATVQPGTTRFNIPKRTVTDLRKLFLGSHHRNYLVVCSLHCDRPGFPYVDRTEVCEAGFVVRQRTLSVPAGEKSAANEALKRFAVARRRRTGAEAQLAAARQSGEQGRMREASLAQRLEAMAVLEADAARDVRAWAERVGVDRKLEGWVPRGIDATGAVVAMPACPGSHGPVAVAGVGEWEPVTEMPEELTEATFPLYPLVPDPRRPDHDGAGTTVYFGVVPTGSSDVDSSGNGRFDDHTTYEIRCYMRRHRPECPREGSQCSCPITWSEATEPYQLASHFDLEGTANRPITVQLPDLDQLRADALRLGPGGTGGVRLQTPPGSAMPFSTKDIEATAKNDTSTQFQICSFSIPLITIVATFLFKLFLPIVVFVFQLWFLLLLKFCIPPDFQVSVELQAALDFVPPSLEIDAQVAIDFAGLPGADDVAAAMAAAVDDFKDKDGNTATSKLAQLVTSGQLDAAGNLALMVGMVGIEAKPPPDRVFAPRVERDQVVVP